MSIDANLNIDTDTLNINISGTFDFTIVHEFREVYENIDRTPKMVIINLQNTESIDSSALGMLLNMKRSMDLGNDKISIINANTTVKKILEIVHFEKQFVIQ